MDKQKVIDAVNNICNVPIADLKKDLVENSSGTNFKALAQYNAMLDNITIGAQTTTTINYAGIDWTLRLLTAEEYVKIRIEMNNECKKHECFDDFFTHYNGMTKILAKALTPSPFKTEGKALFTEADLRLMNYDVLDALYIQYIEFTQLATQKPTEFTAEEVDAMVTIAKKKPELLREYARPKLLQTALWFLNSSLQLEKMLKLDTNN